MGNRFECRQFMDPRNWCLSSDALPPRCVEHRMQKDIIAAPLGGVHCDSIGQCGEECRRLRLHDSWVLDQIASGIRKVTRQAWLKPWSSASVVKLYSAGSSLQNIRCSILFSSVATETWRWARLPRNLRIERCFKLVPPRQVLENGNLRLTHWRILT